MPDAQDQLNARAAEVLEELQAILLSAEFAGSERLSNFLRFIVERYLAGAQEGLKESVIGVEVFGRQPGYDPKIEPIVRVEARRLRTKLDEFYLGAGRKHRVRISVPKGGYVPEIEILPADIESAPLPAAAPAGQPYRTRIWIVSAALCAMAAMGGWLSGKYSAPGNPAKPTRLIIDLPVDQTLPAGRGRSVAISPDGRVVVYAAVRGGAEQLYVRRLDEFSAAPLRGSEGASSPAFSPDGSRVAFFTPGKVVTASLDGRDVRNLASFNPEFRHPAMTWGEDNFIYYSGEAPDVEKLLSGVWRVPSDGSAAPALLPIAGRLNMTEAHFPEQLLPGGQDLLVSVVRTPVDRVLVKRSLRDGRETLVMNQAMGGRLFGADRLMYFWAGNLSMTRLAAGAGKDSGPPVTKVAGVARDGWAGPHADLSRNGSLVYVAGPPFMDRALVWVERAGNATPLDTPPGPWEPLDISRDGKSLLLTKHEVFEQTWSLWLLDLSTNGWRKLTEGGGVRTGGVFSVDGARVIFATDRDGAEFNNLYTIDRDGVPGSERRLLPQKPFGQYPHSVSRCGDVAYLEGIHQTTNTEIWVLPASGVPFLMVGGRGWKRHPAFSPDCRWLTYVSDASGQEEVYVTPFRETGEAVRFSASGGNSPMWETDGTALLYRAGDAMMRVPVQAGRPGQPERLFQSALVRGELWKSNALMAPDGRFLMVRGKSGHEAMRKIHVVLNWLAE